tara:strand:- start:73 stop:543 length:471 start_codon:yes stop_codon:yes gene_type:complete
LDWWALNYGGNMSLLKDLFFYQGNKWWKIPETTELSENPKNEHPFGGFLEKAKNILLILSSGKGHAGPVYYWIIAAILGIITLIEVWWFTVPELRYMLAPAMLIFSIIKFALVVAFFMHLRFDHKMFSTIFITCMVVGILFFSVFLLLSAFHGLGT